MGFITGKVSGSIDQDLTQYSKNVIDQVVFAGVSAMAKVIYDEVKTRTAGSDPRPNVSTGNLDAAIYRVYSPEKSTDSQKTYRISWNHSKAPHGHLVEFGTSRSPAYPFIRPAFDHVQAAIAAGKQRMAEKLAEVT